MRDGTLNARLAATIVATGSAVCIGLDPELEKLPASIRAAPDAFLQFNRAILDAAAPFAAAIKPQMAYYAAIGAEDQLAATIHYARAAHPHLFIILDGKRNDIGPTAAQYAREAFDRYQADTVTVTPYLGDDGVLPFVARGDRGAVILCRTSNPSAGDFQDQPEDDPLYLRVARRAAGHWNKADNVMLVVGATWPADAARIRAAAPSLPFLIPGIGAQGGDLAAIIAASQMAGGGGFLINASRSIIYASSGNDFAHAAAQATRKLRDEVNDPTALLTKTL